MSNDLDDYLREALRSVNPGDKFAQRVMSHIANGSTQSSRSLPAGFRWLSAAIAASAVLAVLITHDWRVRHENRGLEAREQLIEALRVTGEKLDLAYRVVNDETHSAASGNSGA